VLVDTHCHLDFLADPKRSCMQAMHHGVHGIVVPAVDPSNFERVRQLAHSLPGVGYCLGLHPCSVNGLEEQALELLKNQLKAHHGDPRLLGVGEIGLDHFVQGLCRDRMNKLFLEQLRLARDYELPVVLHVRKAQDQVLAGLRRFGMCRGIAHAFNGSQQQAQAYLAQGMVLGFGGAMTYTRASRIRSLAAWLSDDDWVLETDSPDIPPEWLAKGEANQPRELSGIAQCMADLRGSSVEAIGYHAKANALRALPRLAPLVAPL
jgi:TatD DNase family protein